MKLLKTFVMALLATNVAYANTQPSVDVPPMSLVMSVIENQFIFNKSNVDKASIIYDKSNQYVGLELVIKPEFASAFNLMTSNGIGKTMNIAFNNRILSASVIQGALGPSILLTGVSKQDAQVFIDILKHS